MGPQTCLKRSSLRAAGEAFTYSSITCRVGSQSQYSYQWQVVWEQLESAGVAKGTSNFRWFEKIERKVRAGQCRRGVNQPRSSCPLSSRGLLRAGTPNAKPKRSLFNLDPPPPTPTPTIRSPKRRAQRPTSRA